MSKMDNLRAMREARYEQTMKRAGSAPAKPKARPPVAPQPGEANPSKAVPAVLEDDAPATEELCGHRNMSGRTCTREKGHSAKSHRYS